MEKICTECNVLKKNSSFYSKQQFICRSCMIHRRKETDREINVISITKRKCNRCDQIKDVNNFYKEHGYYRSVCKPFFRNKSDLELMIEKIIAKSKRSSEVYNIVSEDIHLLESRLKEINI